MLLQFLKDMITNEVLVSAIGSWVLAQIVKTIIHLFATKKFVPERLIGSGGMPSCHSASMCGLVTSLLINEGIKSPITALACVMAVVVMYDAVGVRRETGTQSAVLNEMIEDFEISGNKLTERKRLREHIGHTPIQVWVGATIGIAFALLYCLVVIK
ncbi:MAG: divergent PAP2 family protein [Lachnospiraceae bacterium]|nr:divergent PAP2 family protein [Lachnospiraceae bacterium]